MKWNGVVGFGFTNKTNPGVFEFEYVEKRYFGDAITIKSRWQPTEHVNDDLRINMKISIMADPFLSEQFHAIKYVEYMGQKWSVSEVTPDRPRIELVLGGLYNGQ